MSSKNMDDDDSVECSLNENITDDVYHQTSPPSYFLGSQSNFSSYQADDDGLGPLPPKWEKAYTEKGEVYFIDHNSSTSHWLDPRLSRIQKKALEDCSEDELPFGWERIDDPLYGTYYIDHVNRQTQYENPVLQAKRNRNDSAMGNPVMDCGPDYSNAVNCSNATNKNFIRDNCDNFSNLDNSSNYSNAINDRSCIFTADPNKLVGERIRSTIIKSYKGLGFTIVGGGDTKDEFLQIKSIVKNGPAWCEGKLQTGDVLVYMNNKCVLGYTHQDMVNLFQSIGPGETVELEVCRGYPLPFDPDDPNTEVVTTVAVGNNADLSDHSFLGKDSYLKRNLLDTDTSDLTDLSVKSTTSNLYPPDKILNVNRSTGTNFAVENPDDVKPRYLTMSIVKGAMGFGFTIADSAYGQKVKKILDKQRCKMLMEGDILIDINNLCVRNMCHSQVVQVLKDCPRNHEATITVERINYGIPPVNNNNAVKTDNCDTGNNNGIVNADDANAVTAITTGNNGYNDVDDNGTVGNSFDNASITTSNGSSKNRPDSRSNNSDNRSKTPTTTTTTGINCHYGDPRNAVPSSSSSSDVLSSRSKTPVNLNNLTAATDVYDNNENNSNNGPSRICYSRSQSPGNDLDANDVAGNNDNTWYKKLKSQAEHHRGGYANSQGLPINRNCCYDNEPVLSDNCYDHRATNCNDGAYYYSTRPSCTLYRKQSTSFEHVQPLPNTMEIRSYGESVDNGNVDIRESEVLESVVTIYRQEAGFGFRIVGGTEEGSQVSIGHIVDGGAAEMDGRLRTGDEIISVDNQLVINSSHHHVVQLMGKAAANGKVTLRIRRKFIGQVDQRNNVGAAGGESTKFRDAEVTGNVAVTAINSSSGHGCRSDLMRYPYDVTVRRNENEGFGFVIISSLNKAGSTIGRIMDGSPAARCGQLHLGDQIIAVNRVNILNLHHSEIVNLIKDSGYAVTLTIGSPVDDSSSTTSIPLSHKEEESEESQYHEVFISRGSRGFGFSIRGGKEFRNMDLFVLQIAENGPAAASGRLKVGDKLIQINGVSTEHMTHAQAIEIIRNGGPVVRLLVQRGGKVPALPTEDGTICSSWQSATSSGGGGSLTYSNDSSRQRVVTAMDKSSHPWVDTRLSSSN